MATEINATTAQAQVGWRRFGPFKSSGGNFYTVATPSLAGGDAAELACFKSSDGSSWTEQDSSNRPNGERNTNISVNAVQYLDAEQDGDNIHVVFSAHAAGVTDDHFICYARFSMSSDAWQAVDSTNTEYYINTVDNNSGDVEANPRVAIGVRSDGDVIVAYNGTRTASKGNDYSRAYYARLESGTWTTDVSCGVGTNADEVIHGLTVEVASGTDLARIYLNDGSGNGFRKLTSANVLDSSKTVTGWGGYGTLTWYPLDTSNDTLGIATVATTYASGSYNTAASYALVGGDSSIEYHTTNGDIDQAETSGLAAVAYDATNECAWLLSRDATTGGRNLVKCDLAVSAAQNSTWSLESAVTSSGEATNTCYSLLVDGTTLRYLYTDTDGDIWYEEYSLGAAATLASVNGVTWANVSNVGGVAKASIAAVNGISV